jgi:hypothetical protein
METYSKEFDVPVCVFLTHRISRRRATLRPTRPFVAFFGAPHFILLLLVMILTATSYPIL